MLAWLMRKSIQQAHARGVQEGRRLQRDDDWARRQAFEDQELAAAIGTPVIVVPNEWDNPIIGFGERLEDLGHSRVLLVHNYVTNQLSWCGGSMMCFSAQRLEIVLGLDPFQLWAITARHTVGHEDFTKPKTAERWSNERILASLEAHGFFARWQAFKEAYTQEQQAIHGD